MEKVYEAPKGEITLTDEQLIVSCNRIYEEGMIWLLLGALISSDNFFEATKNTPNHLYDQMMHTYEYNMYKLYRIYQIIDSCDKIPESDRAKIKKYAEDGVDLLEKEMNKQKLNREK